MRPFPHGTEIYDISQLLRGDGEHIMGSAVPLWLTHLGVTRWGEQWVQEGALEMRFQRELVEGHPLNMCVEHHVDRIDVRVIDDDDVPCVAARLRPVGPGIDATVVGGDMCDVKAAATDVGLRGLRLRPLSFEFDAARDLHMTRDLEDGGVWRDNGWAHPAWLASSANAMIRRSIDFGSPPTWINAGTDIDMHGVVRDGETIVVDGSVNTMFERGRHRFAVIGFTLSTASRRVLSMRYTLIYSSTPHSSGT